MKIRRKTNKPYCEQSEKQKEAFTRARFKWLKMQKNGNKKKIENDMKKQALEENVIKKAIRF